MCKRNKCNCCYNCPFAPQASAGATVEKKYPWLFDSASYVQPVTTRYYLPSYSNGTTIVVYNPVQSFWLF